MTKKPRISEEVISFIAAESKTNIRELIGVLNRVVTFSRIHKKILYMPLQSITVKLVLSE